MRWEALHLPRECLRFWLYKNNFAWGISFLCKQQLNEHSTLGSRDVNLEFGVSSRRSVVWKTFLDRDSGRLLMIFQPKVQGCRWKWKRMKASFIKKKVVAVYSENTPNLTRHDVAQSKGRLAMPLCERMFSAVKHECATTRSRLSNHVYCNWPAGLWIASNEISWWNHHCIAWVRVLYNLEYLRAKLTTVQVW